MKPLGHKQLHSLLCMGNPGSLLMSPPDKIMRSLERRGLVGPWKRDKATGCGTRITPDGMRALADAFEAGRLKHLLSFKKRRRR